MSFNFIEAYTRIMPIFVLDAREKKRCHFAIHGATYFEDYYLVAVREAVDYCSYCLDLYCIRGLRSYFVVAELCSYVAG